MKRVYVNLPDKDFDFFSRVAQERRLSLSAFFRQAAMEKALGRDADQGTTELVLEIQALKGLVSRRNNEMERVADIVATAAGATIGGIPEEKVREKVLGVLSQSPPLRLGEVARAVGYPEAIVLVVASRLVDAGLMVFDPRTMHYSMGR